MLELEGPGLVIGVVGSGFPLLFLNMTVFNMKESSLYAQSTNTHFGHYQALPLDPFRGLTHHPLPLPPLKTSPSSRPHYLTTPSPFLKHHPHYTTTSLHNNRPHLSDVSARPPHPLCPPPFTHNITIFTPSQAHYEWNP